jgi:hypothetical protein
MSFLVIGIPRRYEAPASATPCINDRDKLAADGSNTNAAFFAVVHTIIDCFDPPVVIKGALGLSEIATVFAEISFALVDVPFKRFIAIFHKRHSRQYGAPESTLYEYTLIGDSSKAD